MIDHISIGSTPSEEDCAQVGSPDYSTRARAECKRYLAALIAHYGNPPDGASLRIKSNPHDFGSYHEVNVYYDDESEKAVEYAYKVEAGLDRWPSEAA